MLLSSAGPVPARDHSDAVARFCRWRAREGERISVPGRSRLLSHGRRVPLAVVLLHGFTTCPEQWVRFGTQLFGRGHNVVVPRFPGHGYLDRATRAIAAVRAEDLLLAANDAIDVARGLGSRVVVVGLSIAATVALRAALDRDDILRTVGVAPLFGVARLGRRGNSLLARACELAPSAFVPWDPRGKDGYVPAYAYPKFSTRLLAAMLRMARSVQRRAEVGHVPKNPAVVLLNAHEPACSNDVTRGVVIHWNKRRRNACALLVLQNLPRSHDIVDPSNPNARTDLVYPYLQRLIELPPDKVVR